MINPDIRSKSNMITSNTRIMETISEPTHSSPFKNYSVPKKSNTPLPSIGYENKFRITDPSAKMNNFVSPSQEREKQSLPSFDLPSTFYDIYDDPSFKYDPSPKKKSEEKKEQESEKIIEGEKIEKALNTYDKNQIDCNAKFMKLVEKYGMGYSVSSIIQKMNSRLPGRIRVRMEGSPPCPVVSVMYYTRRDLGYDPALELQMQSAWSKDSIEFGELDRAAWIIWMLAVKNGDKEEGWQKPSVPGEEFWDYL